jgi:hypothetical protein
MSRPARKRVRAARPQIEPTFDPSWNRLLEQFPERLDIDAEVVYALPQELIDCIQRERPGFFTARDLSFERELTAEGRTGFFWGRSFFYPLLRCARELSAEEKALDQQGAENEARLKALIVDELKSTGRSQRQISKDFADDELLESNLGELRMAYAGWLVTTPAFRTELTSFRESWNDVIQTRGRFPTAQISKLGDGDQTADGLEPELQNAFRRFSLPWCVETFSSWELPLPLESAVFGESGYDWRSVESAGLVVFAPWYLLKTKSLALSRLSATRLWEPSPSAIKDWLGPTTFGPKRLAYMFLLYLYFELAIKPRYSDRLKGALPSLDRAFGQFLYKPQRGADREISVQDDVEKIRKAMNKRLRS